MMNFKKEKFIKQYFLNNQDQLNNHKLRSIRDKKNTKSDKAINYKKDRFIRQYQLSKSYKLNDNQLIKQSSSNKTIDTLPSTSSYHKLFEIKTKESNKSNDQSSKKLRKNSNNLGHMMSSNHISSSNRIASSNNISSINHISLSSENQIDFSKFRPQLISWNHIKNNLNSLNLNGQLNNQFNYELFVTQLDNYITNPSNRKESDIKNILSTINID